MILIGTAAVAVKSIGPGMVILQNWISLSTVGSGEYVFNVYVESLVNGADRVVFARNRGEALHVVDRANAHDGAVLGAITLGASTFESKESLKGDAAGVDGVEVTDSFTSVSAIAARASSVVWEAIVLHHRQVVTETGLCQLRHNGLTE